MESGAKAGDSPVSENGMTPEKHPSRTGHVETGSNLGGPSPKAKYYLATDSEK